MVFIERLYSKYTRFS